MGKILWKENKFSIDPFLTILSYHNLTLDTHYDVYFPKWVLVQHLPGVWVLATNIHFIVKRRWMMSSKVVIFQFSQFPFVPPPLLLCLSVCTKCELASIAPHWDRYMDFYSVREAIDHLKKPLTYLWQAFDEALKSLCWAFDKPLTNLW